MKEKYVKILVEGFAGGMAKHYEDDAAFRDAVEKACTCGGTGGAGKRSAKICNHKEGCPAVKVIEKGKLKESTDAGAWFVIDGNRSVKSGPFDSEGEARSALQRVRTKLPMGDKTTLTVFNSATKKEIAESVVIAEAGRPPLSDEVKAARQAEKDEKPKGKRGRPKADPDDDDSGVGGVRDVTLIATIKVDGKKETKEKVLKGLSTDKIDAELSKWEKALNKQYDYEADISIKKKVGDYEDEDQVNTDRAAIDPDGDDY
jgi:hypothetical protein